jgi:hypothetical protein
MLLFARTQYKMSVCKAGLFRQQGSQQRKTRHVAGFFCDIRGMFGICQAVLAVT